MGCVIGEEYLITDLSFAVYLPGACLKAVKEGFLWN